MAYISFEEYEILGGISDETTFNYLMPQAESKINFLTFGRLKNMSEIPDVVKQLEVRIINILSKTDIDRNSTLTSYSNGIESFGYSDENSKGSNKLDSQFRTLAQEYLWEYPNLLYRGITK